MVEGQNNSTAAGKSQGPMMQSGLTGLWRRRWFRVISYIAFACVVVILAAPIAIKHYLQSWLISNGADEAVVRDIDFNPFAGSIRIQGLDAKINKRTVMGDVDIYINIGLTALITRTVTVESATLNNVQLEIERLADGRMRIGSLTFGKPGVVKPALGKKVQSNRQATTTATQATAGAAPTGNVVAEEESEPWYINLRKVRMTDSKIRYLSPELDTTLTISSASVDQVYTAPDRERGEFKLKAHLDGAPVELEVEVLINPGVTLHGSAKVDGLKLKPLTALARPQVEKLGGTASINGDFTFIDKAEQPLSVQYGGSFSLANVAVATEDLDASGRNIGWQGKVTFDAAQPAPRIGLDGTLESSGLDLALPAQPPERAIKTHQGELGMKAHNITLTLAPDAFDINGMLALAGSGTKVESSANGANLFTLADLAVHELKFDSRKQFSVPGIELSGIEIGSPGFPNLRMLLDSLRLESIQVTNLSEISVQSVALAESTVHLQTADPSATPLATMGKTDISNIKYTPEGVTISTVNIDGVKADIVHEQSAKAGAPDTNTKKATNSSDAATADNNESNLKDAQPADTAKADKQFKVSVGQLELSGDSHVNIEDRTVTPTSRIPIKITTFKIKSRDSAQTFGPMDVILDGAVGEHATIKANGMLDASKQNLDLELAVDDVNLITLTPYIVRMMGHQVDSGHLNVDSSIRIADGHIDAQNHLFLRELYMNKASAEIADHAEAEIGVPIGKALNLLRNKHGNIDLDVPISGALSDIRVGLGDAIGTAVRTAIKGATVTYLKLIAPAYGVAATVIEKVKKQIDKIRIDPVVFPLGKAKLPAEATGLIADVAAKLNKDEKLDVRVCPYSTVKDLATIGGKPVGEELDKKMINTMFFLGHKRASEIKNKLMSQHGIEPGRIVICVAKYDKKEDAKPRVAFVF